jgi:hypothetical protein
MTELWRHQEEALKFVNAPWAAGRGGALLAMIWGRVKVGW